MTDANDYNDTNALCIGTQQAGGGNTINGYISNVRLSKELRFILISHHQPEHHKRNQYKTSVLSV